MSAFFEFSITNPLANDFIRYWSNFYDYPDNWKYEQNIGRALTPQSVQLLYEWKNGGKMSEAKSRSVSENYPTCPPEFPEKRYLSADDSGGAIWNIFYLHLTDREKWPIFDQHAYRSMKFIQCGKIQQIPSNKRRIYEIYQREYIPFFNSLVEDDKRIVDKALFSCGRFLKIAGAYKESLLRA
jgi:hypothetical protein